MHPLFGRSELAAKQRKQLLTTYPILPILITHPVCTCAHTALVNLTLATPTQPPTVCMCLQPNMPIVSDSHSAEALAQGWPFAATCCWNGLAVLNAAPFRSVNQGFLWPHTCDSHNHMRSNTHVCDWYIQDCQPLTSSPLYAWPCMRPTPLVLLLLL
jgi:hypothetical protein